MPSLLGTLIDTLAASGVDIARMGLAWARVAPTVAIVPAFGLRALPATLRAVVGLALAAVIFPTVVPSPVALTASWPLLALQELLRGLPVALAAAVPLWAATMAGGVADALRSAQDTLNAPTVEGPSTLLGVPFSLMASAMFLETGGPSRVAAALAAGMKSANPLLAASQNVTAGITLAVAIGAPILAAAVVIEVSAALIARAASPAQIHLLLAPLRALTLLAVMGVVLERVGTVLALAVAVGPAPL